MEQQSQSRQLDSAADLKAQPTDVGVTVSVAPDEKDDDEEDEEEEEDKIVEKSYNNRFHKRNKRLPTQIGGVDNTFIAIEPKSGKEVIWNERMLPEKKTERDNRFLTIVKKLKKQAHPFLIRFLDAWITKNDSGPRKLVFVNERLDDGTLKQFLCNSTSRSKLIAVWTQAVDAQASSEEEKVKAMLANLTDSQQRSFIEACCDPNPANRPKIKALLNHPAVAEVPTLKLLSAKVLVTSMKSLPPEDAAGASGVGLGGTTETIGSVGAAGASSGSGGGKPETPADFAELLRDYISHLEDDTVILDVAFPADQLFKTRTWKDYRSNFTLTSKFLDDVKNGFYPFLGYRFGTVVAEQEEEEEGSGILAGVASTAAAIDGVVSGQPFMATASSGVISNVASSTTSRKHSASVVSAIDTPPRHLPATREISSEGNKYDEFSDAFITAPSAVVAANPAEAALVSSAQFESSPGDKEMRRHSLPDSFADCTNSTSQLKEYVQSMLSGVGAAPPTSAVNNADVGITMKAAADALSNAGLQSSPLHQQTATNAREKRVRQQSTCVCGTGESCSYGLAARDLNASGARPTDQVASDIVAAKDSANRTILARNVPHTPHASIASTLTQSGALSLASVMGATVSHPPASLTAAAAPIANVEETVGVKGEDELSDEDDDSQNDSDEDDDDDEEEDVDAKGGVRGNEKGYDGVPQVVHVPPPLQPPTTAALFTHCQYAYIGAGRWQVYVQMWFVEERLKRVAYLQVLENEWHDYDRIADLFEGSKCLSSGDKAILIRLLAMARHNIPLVEGELVYPCYGPQCNGSICAQELYSKLVTLSLHQQTQELVGRVTSNDAAQAIFSANANASTQQGTETAATRSTNQVGPADAATAPISSVAEVAGANTAVATTIPAPLGVAAVSTLLPSGALTTASEPCCSSLPPSQQHSPGSCPHDYPGRAVSERPQASNLVNGEPQNLPAPSEPQQPATTTTAVRECGTGAVPSVMVASSTSVQTTDSNPLQLQPTTAPTPLKSSQGVVEMLDVGTLAPQNATCALCDRHDYLHCTDLPNYLTSPCYHCRESLAKDAKINPEDLFDLHLQHNVPWPAFLQARFNIPPDGRSLEELIAYDCRWRGRDPCTCLPDSGSLPPCVEFPWLYTRPASATVATVFPQFNPDPVRNSSDVVATSTSPNTTTSDTKVGDDAAGLSTAALHAPVQHPKSLSADIAPSKHQHSHAPALPCASRHPKGSLGPPQCCDPTYQCKDTEQLGSAENPTIPPLPKVTSEPQQPAVETQM